MLLGVSNISSTYWYVWVVLTLLFIAAVIAGEAVGLIHDIPPAGEIVDRIVTEAEQILGGRRNSVAA
jgi:hypothetical protein